VVGRPLAEDELVRLARAGDGDAYEQIVETYQGIAFRTAYALTGNAADAEEAAQDAFLKAYRALGRFRDGAPFRPWLLRIVANEAHNRRRALGRRTRLALRAAEERSPSGDAAPSPEAELLARAGQTALLLAVRTLPEHQRAVITCRFFLELTEEETAAVLGIRRGTVKSRTARALDRLRELDV
jgi:RNA polymerase sigma-70 factor (ECF subfamily)